MKKRLNFITLLLVFAFALQTAATFSEAIFDFKAGFKEGAASATKEREKRSEEKTRAVFLNMIPDGNVEMPDSVYNSKSGNWMPARMIQASVSVPHKSYPFWYDMVMSATMLLFVIPALLTLIVTFIKFILAVNKSIIFDWVNVRRLRIMGICFIVYYIVYTGVDLLVMRTINMHIEIPGYEILSSDAAGAITLILGLVAFLMAEIFSVGLHLKEEQELTI